MGLLSIRGDMRLELYTTITLVEAAEVAAGPLPSTWEGVGASAVHHPNEILPADFCITDKAFPAPHNPRLRP